MSSLDDIRKNINEIDDQLLKLFNERAKWALKIKETEQGKTPIRPEREQAIIKRLVESNKGPLPNAAVSDIFAQLISSFRNHMQLDRPVSVSFLGPAGTYSEEVAQSLFGKTIELYPEDSISGVIRSVESGTAQLGVVPLENSSEGAVVETQKLLADTSLSIVAEMTKPIVHCLLSKEKNLDSIKNIYGHPQAIGQCRGWLATHIEGATIIPATSNAAAAELASKNKDSAAIASRNAANIYDLEILAHGINDNPGNETRFVALGNIKTKPTGDDKTSIMCVLNDRPGALHSLLGILAERSISMTRLESHHYSKNEYAFFIDFPGHQDEETVKSVLKLLKENTKILKILGSYPVKVTNL